MSSSPFDLGTNTQVILTAIETDATGNVFDRST